MGYSIGQVAEKMGLTTHTLRYYDKEGLLPFVQKSKSGLRVFGEKDIEWLVLIECLKGVGMTLKDIKQYIDWIQAGDVTLEKRLDMFKRQKEKLNAQMAQLKQYQQKIDYKIAYYTEAVKKGTINAAESSACLKAEKERIFGKTLREAG